jgi:hypothetical protein
MTEQEFFDILGSMPDPKALSYRLYHDDRGRLLFYSMEDLPGTWVEIDQELFSRSPSRVRVIDGRVHELEWRQSVKLRPSQNGTPCHAQDVTIVYDYPNAQCWAVTAYEQD